MVELTKLYFKLDEFNKKVDINKERVKFGLSSLILIDLEQFYQDKFNKMFLQGKIKMNKLFQRNWHKNFEKIKNHIEELLSSNIVVLNKIMKKKKIIIKSTINLEEQSVISTIKLIFLRKINGI